MARTTRPVSQATLVAYKYVGLSRGVLLADDARRPGLETSTVMYSNRAPLRTNGDLAEAEAAIDRIENLSVDFRWAARDIAVLWLRALLSQSRGEEDAYQDLAQRCRSDGDITWYEGHTKWADVMPLRGPFTRSVGRNPKKP
jgi:hypothetical protein